MAITHPRRPLVLLAIAFAVLAWVGWGIRRRIALDMHLAATFTVAEERLLHSLSHEAIDDLVRTLQSDPDRERRSDAGDALSACRSEGAFAALAEASHKEDSTLIGDANMALRSAVREAGTRHAWLKGATPEQALAQIRAANDGFTRAELFEAFVSERADLLVPLARELLQTDDDSMVAHTILAILCDEQTGPLILRTRVPRPSEDDTVACLQAGMRNPDELQRRRCRECLVRYTDAGLSDDDLSLLIVCSDDSALTLRILGYLDHRRSPDRAMQRSRVLGFTKDAGLAKTILDGLDSRFESEGAADIAMDGLHNEDAAIRAACEKWLSDRGVEVPKWRQRK